MIIVRRIGLALAVLAAALVAAPASAQSSVAFNFSAPLSFFGNPTGDVAAGSGTLTIDAADSTNRYLVTGVQGSFTFYDGDATRAIDGVSGFTADFEFPDPYLYTSNSGALTTDGLFFFGDDGAIGLARRDDGLYDGFAIEVGVSGATLSFTPLTAAAPEPASWALMIVGFGAVGYAMRRRPQASVRFA